MFDAMLNVTSVKTTNFFERRDIGESCEFVKSFNVKYSEGTGVMCGSNLPIAARLDTMMRLSGLGRVANLADLGETEILKFFVEGKHYVIVPALVLRSKGNCSSKNYDLIKSIEGKIEDLQGKLRLPVLITGFDAQLNDKKEYGWEILPRNDFSVMEDERLERQYNGRRFNKVDEFGLPYFDSKGSRTWYVSDKRISRLGINSNLDIFSESDFLDHSDFSGRLIKIVVD